MADDIEFTSKLEEDINSGRAKFYYRPEISGEMKQGMQALLDEYKANKAKNQESNNDK